MKLINKPIQMVCVFEKDGRVTPFKFRMEDEFGEDKTFKVKPLRVDKSRTLLNFHCAIEVDGKERDCNIHYYVAEMKWVLYQIG